MVSIQGNPPLHYDGQSGLVSNPPRITPIAELRQTLNPDEPERRLIPDRRQRRLPWNHPERRQKNRRAPLLLNPKNAQPEPLASAKGRLLDTTV